MSETDTSATGSAGSVGQTLQSIAALRDRHREAASWRQRAVVKVSELISRPSALAAVAFIVIAWIAGNLAAPTLGVRALDTPPFAWLLAAVTLASLIADLLILSAQKHEDELNRQRDNMVLELSMLSEQKSAKIIELLEELRRDSPHVRNRVDREADDLAKPSDARARLDNIAEAAPAP